MDDSQRLLCWIWLFNSHLVQVQAQNVFYDGEIRGCTHIYSDVTFLVMHKKSNEITYSVKFDRIHVLWADFLIALLSH